MNVDLPRKWEKREYNS